MAVGVKELQLSWLLFVDGGYYDPVECIVTDIRYVRHSVVLRSTHTVDTDPRSQILDIPTVSDVGNDPFL